MLRDGVAIVGERMLWAIAVDVGRMVWGEGLAILGDGVCVEIVSSRALEDGVTAAAGRVPEEGVGS